MISLTIYEDKGNVEGMHKIKNKWFADNGYPVVRVPLPVGDYIFENEKVLDVINRKIKRGLDVKKMDLLGSYNTSVDTKRDIIELVGNVCGKAEHLRFRDELILAQNNNIKLYILVENRDSVYSIDDLFRWHNPRLDIYKNSDIVIGTYKNGRPKYKKIQRFPGATTGQTLAKACLTMQLKYGVTFLFCKPEESAKKIIELLGGA